MSGAFTVTTRVAILDRDQCCVGCGSARDLTIQHRRARGMGGSKDPATRSASNGLVLCGSGTTGCHGWAEAHPGDATFLGWRVAQHENPADVPAYRHRAGGYGPHFARLAEDGSWSWSSSPSLDVAWAVVEAMLTRRPS